MSKVLDLNTGAEKTEEKQDVKVNIDDYVYEADQKVEVEGALLVSAISVLREVWGKEVTYTFPMEDTLQKTAEGGEARISEIGVKVWAILDGFVNTHLKEISEGRAVLADKEGDNA